MVQQTAIHEQGCKLIVSAPLSRPNKGIIFFDRMQVRIFSVLVNKYLTRSPYSRKVGPQQFPLRMWGRVSARRAQRMSQRNPRDRPERHRTMGKRLGQVSCLLVERSGRDGEEHHREDHRGEAICRWPARSLLLLFAGFRGSEEPSDDIPNTGRPTRPQVHRISINPPPIDTVGSRHRL